MSRIETYVFLTIVPTNNILCQIPGGELGMPDIAELSMVAVKRTALHLCEVTEEPRVQNKFTMFFNTSDTVQEVITADTGLKDALLEKEVRFDKKVLNAINSFIDCLQKPVCLISHGGFMYVFPVLKYHLEQMNGCLASDIICTDSHQVFFDLSINEKYAYELHLYPTVQAKMNEAVSEIGKPKSYKKLVRNPYYAPDVRPHESYNLGNIYKRRVKEGNFEEKKKTAEDYCFMMMKIAQTFKGFENWVQNEHCLFSDIPIYPPLEETWCLDDDDPEETEIKDSYSSPKEVKESSEQREDKPLSRWYNIFNYF